jgi:hypothetical protein
MEMARMLTRPQSYPACLGEAEERSICNEANVSFGYHRTGKDSLVIKNLCGVLHCFGIINAIED